ncbi:hypothetical protein [Archangium lipolyticum]|nr:hypothetical protein [Archangium lipolyticum]
MNPRDTSPRLSRPVAAGLVLWALVALLQPAEARAGNARLLTLDEAAAIKHPVIGLQRSALPLALGFALDTSVLADLALTPNLGLRWGVEAGPHRFVVGARYAKFMGASLISDFVTSQEPAVKRYDASFSGPSFYALYGVSLGRVLVQAEARHSRYQATSTSVTGAVVINFAGNWSVVGEFGTVLREGLPLRGAAGIRYAGENLGLSLGAAYVDLTEPMLPYNGGRIPVIPAFDLSWTFR